MIRVFSDRCRGPDGREQEIGLRKQDQKLMSRRNVSPPDWVRIQLLDNNFQEQTNREGRSPRATTYEEFPKSLGTDESLHICPGIDTTRV